MASPGHLTKVRLLWWRARYSARRFSPNDGQLLPKSFALADKRRGRTLPGQLGRGPKPFAKLLQFPHETARICDSSRQIVTFRFFHAAALREVPVSIGFFIGATRSLLLALKFAAE